MESTPELIKLKKKNIAGATFHEGTVIWEDAFKVNKASGVALLEAITAKSDVGPKLTTGPWVTKLNKHIVVCHEWCEETGTGDFTVFPEALLRT